MPTSGRDNTIRKLKREPVAIVTPDAVIGKVKYWKDFSGYRIPRLPIANANEWFVSSSKTSPYEKASRSCLTFASEGACRKR